MVARKGGNSLEIHAGDLVVTQEGLIYWARENVTIPAAEYVGVVPGKVANGVFDALFKSWQRVHVHFDLTRDQELEFLAFLTNLPPYSHPALVAFDLEVLLREKVREQHADAYLPALYFAVFGEFYRD